MAFSDLKDIYENTVNEEQRRLIGSMFLEKFKFQDLKHRTAKVRGSFYAARLINSKLKSKKRRKDFLKVLAQSGADTDAKSTPFCG